MSEDIVRSIGIKNSKGNTKLEKIDFVVLWVDGNDPAWRKERAKYIPSNPDVDENSIRYRDWGVLKYWFRGVEKFAPWVNHIYFVTCGHFPEWLNLEHPKLTHIKHEQYIPKEYLPTFNSNVIELHIHKIPNLSEKFVLFNDDMFLTDDVKETDFFRNGLPCETALLGQISPIEWGPWIHSVVNNMTLINQHFSKKEVIRNNYKKFFSLNYGKFLFQNVLLSASPNFSCFKDTHLPTSHLRSTFMEVWQEEPELLKNSSGFRTRNREELSHWLMKYWQMCRGCFYPRSVKWGKMYTLGKDMEWSESIRKQTYKAVCLNDGENIDFEQVQREMLSAFDAILPEKSQFEKA